MALWINGILIAAPFVPFEELPQHNFEEVETRGFLYPLDGDNWVLSSQPNLKSCCVGSKAKQKEQVIVTGNIVGSPQSAVNMKGFFKVGEEHFRLEKASIVERERSSMPWVLGAMAMLVIIVLLPRLAKRF